TFLARSFTSCLASLKPFSNSLAICSTGSGAGAPASRWHATTRKNAEAKTTMEIRLPIILILKNKSVRGRIRRSRLRHRQRTLASVVAVIDADVSRDPFNATHIAGHPQRQAASARSVNHGVPPPPERFILIVIKRRQSHPLIEDCGITRKKSERIRSTFVLLFSGVLAENRACRTEVARHF